MITKSFFSPVLLSGKNLLDVKISKKQFYCEAWPPNFWNKLQRKESSHALVKKYSCYFFHIFAWFGWRIGNCSHISNISLKEIEQKSTNKILTEGVFGDSFALTVLHSKTNFPFSDFRRHYIKKGITGNVY